MEVGFGDRRDCSFFRLDKRELIYSKRTRQESESLPPSNEIFAQQVPFPVVADRPDGFPFGLYFESQL